MKQFIRFLIVGGSNTALTYGLYLLLLWLGLHYQLALVMDYLCGILVGYTFNRQWTFADRGKKLQSFFRYAATYVAVYFGNAVLLTAIVEMHWLGPALGQLVSLAVVAMISFFIQKYWVFNKNSKDGEKTPP